MREEVESMGMRQRRHVMKAAVPVLVLALSAGAMSACSSNNSDTTSTEATVEEAPTTMEATVEEAPTTMEATVEEAPTTTEATVEEAPTTTAVEEPATLTAETTGNVTLDAPLAIETDPDTGLNVAGEPTGEFIFQIEVTMDDGSVRSFPTDEETLELIWPDGTTAAGVRVAIEEVDGEQRITGPAE